MRKNRLLILRFLSVSVFLNLLLIVSCCAPREPRLISLDDFRLTSVSNDSLQFVVDVTLENAEDREGTLTRANYRINCEGRARAAGYWEGRVQFPPGQQVSLSLPANVASDNVEFWLSLLLSDEAIELEIPVDFTVDTRYGYWSFSIAMETDISLDGVFRRWLISKVIELSPRLENISLPSLSLLSSSIYFSISLKNDYPFDMEIEHLEVDLYISDTPIGSISSNQGVIIESVNRTPIDLELEVNNLGPFRSSIMSVLNGELNYTIVGTAHLTIKGISVIAPFEKSGTVVSPGFL